MNKTAKQIRRAFENITPNVLDRVLSQSVYEKGAVIPMTEKKPFIPFALQRVASMAAMVVLLIAIGYVGLMILGGRTGPQMSDVPTEPPTEAPTEPVTIPEGPASEEKAIAYMKQHVKDPGKYTLVDYKQDPYTEMVTADFVYLINGVRTDDSCHVFMRPDGNLYDCIVRNEGAFDGVRVTDEMLRKAEENLYSMYYGLSKESCTVEDRSIVLDEGVVSVQFVVKLPEPNTFLVSYTVPLTPEEVTYNREMAIERAKKYFLVTDIMPYFHVESEPAEEDGFAYFRVSFQTGGYQYTCEIGMFTGEVRNATMERLEPWSSDSETPPPVSEEHAIEITLKHRQVADRAQAKELATELVTDDGNAYYKVSFRYNGKAYVYQIDASTGSVLQFQGKSE